ncbi:MAG: hypothetical protein N2484_08920 [Clostridia bacterium]|nr:hypothetical protein [Clostridia bacterium]
MKHLFTSGEILYKKNVKKLEQGSFLADTLQYGEVGENTVFEAEGNIDDKPVIVKFTIKQSCCEELKFKSMLKILMQSDLMEAEWENYEIQNL